MGGLLGTCLRRCSEAGQTNNPQKSNQQMMRDRTLVDSLYQTSLVGPVVFFLMTSGPSKTFGVAVADRGSK